MTNPPVPSPSYAPPSNCTCTALPYAKRAFGGRCAGVCRAASAVDMSSSNSSTAHSYRDGDSSSCISSSRGEAWRSSTRSLGWYCIRSIRSAYNSGCALCATFRSARSSLLTRMVRCLAKAVNSASLNAPSRNAFSSRRTRLSDYSSASRQRPHVATGAHSRACSGCR